MVSSVLSLLSYELPDTFIASTPQFWNYVQAPSWYDRAGDGLYADFGVNIVHGIVWFWILEQWRALPKELWAWKCVKIRTVGHYYNGWSIWVPSLLLFDFWEYKDNPAQFLNSQAVTFVIDRQPALRTTSIAPRLFECFRNSGDSKMARTCRLVCRDWARECAVREPNGWRVEDGVVKRWVETGWQILPTKLWAWTLGPFADEWWVEQRCHQRWVIKLLQPVDSESIHRNVNNPSTLPLPSQSGTFRSPNFLIARTLPPELFQYICDAADGKSWSSRLVCRYWNRQCTPHVLRQIDVKESPERIRALWKHRADPTLVRHLKGIENVPWYDKNSKFPWIHLLSQTCTSTKSVWKSYWGSTESMITILGPFPGGHRSMRSVHFALPRPPPRALSRGIKKLYLDREIHFRRYEDLSHLVCELPDLEDLWCRSTFGPLPTELPRRRPRTNRNKLRKCRVGDLPGCNATLESIYTPGTLCIALYMSVYDAASFFSEAEILSILALLKTARTHEFITAWYSHDPEHHSQILGFCDDNSLPFLPLHILRDGGSHVHTTLTVGVDCRYQYLRTDEPEVGWKQNYWKDWKCTDADAKFREDTAPLRHARFVLGFGDRRQLKHFVKTVLEEDPPAIFRDATLHYGIWDWNAVEIGSKDDDGNDCRGAWRQASLDSEEFTGKPRRKLLELYS